MFDVRKEHTALHITISEFESNRMLRHWQRSHNFCYLMIVLVREAISAKLVLSYKHKSEAKLVLSYKHKSEAIL